MIPIAIEKNIYVNSSGSLIGDLNLIIDKAPTNPKDNAKEDLITAITIVVVIVNRGKIFIRDSLFEIVFEYLL